MKYLVAFYLSFISLTLMAQQQFIAHRGASWIAPENTLAAVNLAWELGADAVEVDVHLSKDNRVMVIHDKDTKRTCSGKKNFVIKNSPSVLLRDLEVGSWKDDKYRGEKIPFLSEVAETIPYGKILVVEIKCGKEIIPHLQRVVNSSKMSDQFVFISFGWQTILETKKKFPGNKCYWLSSLKAGLKNKMENAAGAGLEGVNLNHKIIDEGVMKMAGIHDLEVLTWTVDDPKEAKRLTGLGVAGITTNRPKWLKEQIHSGD